MVYYSKMEYKKEAGSTESKRLEYFLQVAATGSYTEAAELMFTTQSNVSKQILALEKELRVQLFERTARRANLTAAGQALLPRAQAVVAAQEQLCRAMAACNGEQTPLRLYAIPVMGMHGVTDVIAGFHREHPLIQLQVVESESIDLLQELESGRCDVAYMRLNRADPNRFDRLTVMEDRFAVVLPAGHPLSSRQQIDPAELREEAFLQLNEKTRLFGVVQQICAQAGFEPRVLFTGDHIDNILDLVAKGMGISILMEQAVRRQHTPGLAVVPLQSDWRSYLSFVRLRQAEHSRAAGLFWRYLHRCYPKSE